MPLLQVDSVTAGYGDTEILRNLSIAVEPNEIVSIIGPNGAGKSTLMKTVFGLLHPHQGSVTFNDQDITHAAPYKIVLQGMCYVPQVAYVFTTLTVEENLEMGAFPLGKANLAERKDGIYAMFPKLRERRRQLAGKMSGGERQMVAMGSALMLNPKLLLLDEPTAALSPKLVDEIFERIGHIRDTGIAILMVEQNARQSLQLADRGYVLASGQNRHEGTGRDLLADPNVGKLYLGG